jgi:hypothetical protein
LLSKLILHSRMGLRHITALTDKSRARRDVGYPGFVATVGITR